MYSIKVCISLKSGNKIEEIYVRIYGAYTLLGVISRFDYIWSFLCKSDNLSDKGCIVSITDADMSRARTNYCVTID